jgi:diguanylate cyclase (GGDEF)-like protein
MIDLKHFKKINEKYGHLVGDFVLKKLVEIIRKTLRKEHKIYRVSGDEFVIVLNRMDLEGVKKVVDRILAVVKKTKFKYKDEFIKVEIVLGITSHKKGDSIKNLIHRVYEAISITKQKNNDYIIV